MKDALLTVSYFSTPASSIWNLQKRLSEDVWNPRDMWHALGKPSRRCLWPGIFGTLASPGPIYCILLKAIHTDSSMFSFYKSLKVLESLPHVPERPQAQRGKLHSVYLMPHRKEVVRTRPKFWAVLPPCDMCCLLPNTDIEVCPGLWFSELSSLPGTSVPGTWLLRCSQLGDML